jgi:uracil-DNA glycosylase
MYQRPDAPAIIASYHPSRQNTHTGRLTPAMLKDVFGAAVRLLARPKPPIGPPV